MSNPKRILSLDIPWGKSNVVGIAYYDSFSPEQILVSAVSGKDLSESDGFEELETALESVKSFIACGASESCLRKEDAKGPFGNFPSCPKDRRDYLKFLYSAFVHLRSKLGLDEIAIDVATVDLPLVTSETIRTVKFTKRSTYRPVELAFASKVMIPGASKTRADGRIQFARFQAGIHNGCRAGHAVFDLVARIFSCNTTIESFPQLSLGALAEYAARNNGTLVEKLAAHKTGNIEKLTVGQRLLYQQLIEYLGNVSLEWQNPQLAIKERGDAYDAILGLLPAIELTRLKEKRVCQPVLLRNVSNGELALPSSNGAGKPTSGSRDWITDFSEHDSGLVDSGILTLDISLWR